MGTLRWKKVYVERLPIPRIAESKQQPFIQLVDQILEQPSKSKADTSETESEIDEKVYQLYGLTSLEVSTVEEGL